MPTATRHRRSNRVRLTNNHIHELRQRAADVGDSFKAMAATAGTAAGDSLGPVEDYVRQKPIKSLLLALAAGAVLGAIFLRR